MARRLDDASKSPYNLKYNGPETTKVAKDIDRASRSLLTNVTQMMTELDLFVSALEKVQVTVEREQPPAEDILRWLKFLLKAPSPPLPPSAGPKEQQPESAFPISALREAAAQFSTADAGTFLEYIILSPSKDKSD